MRSRILILVLLVLAASEAKPQNALVFNSVNDAMHYAEQQSVSQKTSHAQYLLAKYEVIAKSVGILDPKATISASVINNLQLPVNFLPAEAFGGPEGTFQELKMGQQYVSGLNLSPQIDIINLASWSKLRSAKTDLKLAEVNELFAKKSLMESVAAAYFNVVSLQEQITILSQSLTNNDSILQIAKNKYASGIIRQQDLNQIEVNRLMMEDKILQLTFNLKGQIKALKLLCDMNATTALTVTYTDDVSIAKETVSPVNNGLLSQQGSLKLKLAQDEYRTARSNLFPTVAMVGNWSMQDNSNEGFFNSSSQFNSYYVGLRLSYNIPSSAYFSKQKKARTNFTVSKLSGEHLLRQEQYNNEQLSLDVEKGQSKLINSEKILALREDTYQKNRNIYEQDLLSTDMLLLSLNDRINATSTHRVDRINYQYYLIRMEINRTIQ